MAFGVGVIGAGTVGGGVIKTLRSNRAGIARRAGVDIVLRHVADKDARQFEEHNLEGVRVSSDASALLSDPDVQVVAELIGGIEPAKTFILKALAARKNVVTANKMLLAHHGPELARAAQENGVDLRYEASVAGTIPIVKALREGLVADEIESVYGILNGTCNYILTQMTYKDIEFEEALAQAIALGFAETPPDLDIEGHDTAHKCQILASLCYAMHVDLENVDVEGITGVRRVDVASAREMGYVVKLLAIIRKVDDEIEARVHPTLVPEKHLLASVRNEFNAVYVKGDVSDVTMYYGRGAGRMPTAGAVISDIVDIARRGSAPPVPAFLYVNNYAMRSVSRHVGRYYIRVTPEDTPGVLGKICGVLGAHKISIAACFQKENESPGLVHVVLITHEAQEALVCDAVAEIDRLGFVREASQMLRVL